MPNIFPAIKKYIVIIFEYKIDSEVLIDDVEFKDFDL